MQKPKVGSVIIVDKDIDELIVAGTLGVVLNVEEDAKTWGVKSLTVDFGSRKGKLLKYDINDMSLLHPIVIKTSKAKDSVGKDLSAKL
ncbi:MAG: hypothetical protein WC346_02955 [Methanogenium sp.]|jgi:hypothetical protein